MAFTRACLGLAVVEVSAQDFATFPEQPLPGMPDPLYQQVPDMQMMYQQMPDTQMLYQQMPDMQTGYSPSIQSEFQAMPEFQQVPGIHMPFQPQVPEEIRPDDGSEVCKVKQAENPLHLNMSPLTVGSVYCSQAADSRWWDVTVKEMNCDGSYSVEVKDDVGTTWPVAQRAYFLDKPCDEFYRDALREEGLSPEEIEASLKTDGLGQHDSSANVADHHEPPANHDQPATHQPVEESRPTQPSGDVQTSAKKSRWPSLSDKKTPWKVVAGAAAAGAVPLIYGLTGS